jgi:hypothetical protein
LNYTLFIDESGDFESQRGEWLISGALFAGTLQEVNHTLKTKLKDFPQEIGVSSIKDFHLTEFREIDHSTALDKAEAFLSKVTKITEGFKALAVINFAKHSLSKREKTYRAMLADMLALVDSVIPDNEEITHLDLVIATRTIYGELQTTIDDLQKDVVNSLPQALEYDLASLGITGLIGKNLKVTQDYANNLWGLVCADFIANINYNRKKKNEKEYLTQLELSGVFTGFEAFGNHHERRARIAERNNDYPLAIFRWVLISLNQPEICVLDTITRLLSKIYQSSGSSGAKTNLESLIEKIWRHFSRQNDYDSCLISLELLEKSLQKSPYSEFRFKPDFTFFRIRNLKLLLLNHQGETSEAADLISKQQVELKKLSSNPEYISVVFDFNLIELEFYVNSLDLKTAKSKADKYLERIESYREVWSLFNEDSDDGSGFENASFFIKSQMAALRIYSLESKTPSSEIEARFNVLETLELGSFDRSRLQNYHTLYLLKSNQPLKSLEELSLTEEKIKSCSAYDLFWILNAINSVLIDGHEIKVSFEKPLLEKLDDEKLLKNSHPNDIIWREAALYFWLRKDKSKSLKFIKRAQSICSLKNSNISGLLKDMNVIFEAIFKGKLNDLNGKLLFLDKAFLKQSDSNESLIKAIKNLSPY